LALHVEKIVRRRVKGAAAFGGQLDPFSRMHLAKISFVELTKETAVPARYKVH
jgi:hypothetical protein